MKSSKPLVRPCLLFLFLYRSDNVFLCPHLLLTHSYSQLLACLPFFYTLSCFPKPPQDAPRNMESVMKKLNFAPTLGARGLGRCQGWAGRHQKGWQSSWWPGRTGKMGLAQGLRCFSRVGHSFASWCHGESHCRLCCHQDVLLLCHACAQALALVALLTPKLPL